MTGPNFELPGRLCQKHRRALDDRLTLVSSGFQQARYRRIIDHIKYHICRNWPVERRFVHGRRHSEGSGIDQQIAATGRSGRNFTPRKHCDSQCAETSEVSWQANDEA